MQRFFIALSLLACSLFSFGQDLKKQRWVDSVFSKLKTEEKIGQLFLIEVSSSASKKDRQALADQCKSGKIGGVIIRKSGLIGYAKLMNWLQITNAKIPLLIKADISQGLSQTIDSTMAFFDSQVLNAVTDDSLLLRLHSELARQASILQTGTTLYSAKDSIEGLKTVDLHYAQVNPKFKKGELEKETVKQGAVFLLNSDNIDASIKVISKAIKKDKILASQLDSTVKQILSVKYDGTAQPRQRINTDNLFARLHTSEAMLLKQKLAEASVTVLKNDADIIPIRKLDSVQFVSLSIGKERVNEFTRILSKHQDIRRYSVMSSSDTTGLPAKLKDGEVIIVELFPSSSSLAKEVSLMIEKLSMHHPVIVCSFSDPGELAYFKKSQALVAAYRNEPEILRTAAQIIFGGIGAKGKLSVKIDDSIPVNSSIKTNSINRFAYSLPEGAGMDSHVLERIEPIAREAVAMGATPGCHVLVARNGKVVYEKSFGTLTYDKKNEVTDETIYDLASVTKVSATLQTVMYMYDKGLIDVNKKASVYLPELKGSNKEDFIIKDILTHQAGLWPYLPFWSETVKDSTVFNEYYRHSPSEDFPYPVAENMFASKAMKDSLWQWIIHAKIREKSERSIYDYRYSDMGFYIMQHLAEKMLGQPMEDFLQKNIYRPLGAWSTGYLPLRKFPASQIAPTEHDTLFRKSLLVGYVHDQGAAMHGGIAGHAGLFSDANDLAKLGQMWLNKGSYGGVQFFKPETIDLFTSKQYETSRRGLGWDKPVLNSSASPTSIYASAKTFGHTGFTGTCIWVDPEFNLVYVFLSNRVNPDMNNNKILNANIRPRIQDVIYQSIFEFSKTKMTSCN